MSYSDGELAYSKKILLRVPRLTKKCIMLACISKLVHCKHNTFFLALQARRKHFSRYALGKTYRRRGAENKAA